MSDEYNERQWKKKAAAMKDELATSRAFNWREMGNAYVALLQIPPNDPWRIKHQAAYADMRDAIAAFFKRTEEYTQECFEEQARESLVQIRSTKPPKIYVRQADGTNKLLSDTE